MSIKTRFCSIVDLILIEPEVIDNELIDAADKNQYQLSNTHSDPLLWRALCSHSAVCQLVTSMQVQYPLKRRQTKLKTDEKEARNFNEVQSSTFN